MQAADKITTLEARLEDLATRRRNNSKLVREMKEKLKRNAIVYDTRRRMEVEKQITNLENDLTDIGREEHDLGLQLHRAQKKRDRENCYENPTGLWIKRVTT
jgi:predicted  nucleic acid-binding Zn-ribbon protein